MLDKGSREDIMETLSSQQLNRRINTFMDRKNEQYPELKLRPAAKKQPKHYTAMEVFSEVVAGIKWEFGR